MARDEATSYAAYQVLSQRYSLAGDSSISQDYFDTVMANLGYDRNITTTVGDSPAAVGNRTAQTILNTTINDGSNEANPYMDNTGYFPINGPMIVNHPSVTGPFETNLTNASH